MVLTSTVVGLLLARSRVSVKRSVAVPALPSATVARDEPMMGRDAAARTEEVDATELDSANRPARLLPRMTRKRLLGRLRRRKRPLPRLSIRAIRPSLPRRVRQIG